jgi:hypothetical protein
MANSSANNSVEIFIELTFILCSTGDQAAYTCAKGKTIGFNILSQVSLHGTSSGTIRRQCGHGFYF